MALEQVSSAKCFGGFQKVFKHKRSGFLFPHVHNLQKLLLITILFSLIAKLCLFSNPAKPDAERVLFNRHPRDRARGARLSNQEEVICVPKPTLYIFCTCNDLN